VPVIFTRITLVVLYAFVMITMFIFVTLAALGGLVVSVLATGPTGHSVAGSNPTEDGGFHGL
jgi:hypothetical protein